MRALRLLNPPPAKPVWGWGELRRRMGKNVTAKPGRYRVSFTPYQKIPQESFTAPEVQVTVLYWGKRLGKTEMINNLHGSVIEQAPCNILVVYPTLDSAKKWSKQFFAPMVRSTPELKKLLRETGRRESNNTILAKEYPGGTISAIGANSPSGFRQVQAPVVTLDEIDAMESGKEGDPIELAFGRAENYGDSIQVVASTATMIGSSDGEEKPVPARCNILEREVDTPSGSRIHDWWLKSDQQMWFVPCGCGKWHVLRWCNVKWPDGHKHEEAYYETPCCGAKWNDYDRARAILAGEWRATAPFKGIRGFWLNGLNTVFPAKKGYKSKLHQFAAEFYRAYKAGKAAMIVWKNTFLCEPHEDAGERLEGKALIERGEDYTPNKLPKDVIIALAGIDVQKDRIEVETMGLGLDDETWGIEAVRLFGDTEQVDVWQDLAQFLAKKYKRADGVEIPITASAIDMRHKPNMVREFVKKCGLPRVYPVYGANNKTPIMVTTRFDKRHRLRTYAIATKVAKDTIFARLRVEEVGSRFCHFPKVGGYDEEYFAQLTAEVLKTKYLRGFAEQYYEKIRERNEALDRRVYLLAAIDILRPNLTAIARQLASGAKQTVKDYELKPTEEAKTELPKPTQPRQAWRRPRMGGGFVNGWR